MTDPDTHLRNDINREIQTFHRMGRLQNTYDFKSDNLQERWEIMKANGCPHICELAKRIFAIQATSASSERLFSIAGNHQRTNLNSNLFQSEVFIKGMQNLRKRFPDERQFLF